MSQKRDRQIRMIARHRYEMDLFRWRISQPAKWRIFKYMRWKKRKPVYEYTEKQIKKIVKGKGGT